MEQSHHSDRGMLELRKLFAAWAESDTAGEKIAGLQGRVRSILEDDRQLLARAALQAFRSEPGDVAGYKTSASPIQAVLVKPMGDACNLGCTYCYELRGGRRTSTKRMTPDVLRRTIETVFEQADQRVTFVWHGGEPTLVGLPFMRRALDLQKSLNVKCLEVSNSIQTHGVGLTNEWISFFRTNHFSIGVSLDGTEDLHDKSRVDLSGAPTYDRAYRTIRKLVEAGLSVGLISVVSESWPGREAEIVNQLTSLGVASLDFHPRFGMFGEEPPPISPEIFARVMINLFDCWLETGCQTGVLTFDEALRFFLGADRKVCYFSGRCSSVAAIEANGTVVSCTRPFDLDRYTFGNVTEQSLAAITTGSAFTRFQSEDRSAIASTANCRWHNFCANGCPQHRSSDGRPAVNGANLFCRCASASPGGYAAIWEHIERRLTRIIGPADL
jgi:uncharacterized protein